MSAGCRFRRTAIPSPFRPVLRARCRASSLPGSFRRRSGGRPGACSTRGTRRSPGLQTEPALRICRQEGLRATRCGWPTATGRTYARLSGPTAAAMRTGCAGHTTGPSCISTMARKASIPSRWRSSACRLREDRPSRRSDRHGAPSLLFPTPRARVLLRGESGYSRPGPLVARLLVGPGLPSISRIGEYGSPSVSADGARLVSTVSAAREHLARIDLGAGVTPSVVRRPTHSPGTAI